MGITIEGKEKKGEFKLSEAEKKLWEEDDVGITIDDLPGEDSSKRLLVLMIVDATPSMSGQAIGQVNYALQELVSELKMFESENAVNLELAILSFTNSIRWEMKPRNIRDCYDIPQIRVRPGLTQYGVFYHELNKMLNREHLLGYSGKQAAPVLILLTDGSPADEYQDDLRDLRKNGYFMLANRSAVVMGEGAEDPAAHAAAVEFASDESKVLTAGKYSEIVKSIRLATLHTLKNDFPAGEEEDSDPDGGDPSAGENPDEDDPFAEVNPDSSDPFAKGDPGTPFVDIDENDSDIPF